MFEKSRIMTSVRDLLISCMRENSEVFADVVSSTMSTDQMEMTFDNSYGVPECSPFVVWTKARVYFPVCYDGHISVETVPRNPGYGVAKMFGSW